MLTGIHFLLTYECNYECDHCFLFCGPHAKGTFTLSQLKNAINQVSKIDSVTSIYFEGGEPFIYYPLMLRGISLAHDRGFEIGVVSNAYWATCQDDAEFWLQPLCKFNITDLSISDDAFHYDQNAENLAKNALAAANKLNLPVASLCVDPPESNEGNLMFKGRAVEKLIQGLPTKSWEEFTQCPHEDLKDPGRVHVDALGNVHLCQGLSMGNMWETPLSEMVKNYHGENHPICGPLIKGGPAQLARHYKLQHQETYVDACHFCYLMRKSLIDKFPQYLTPNQVYGLD
jgi:organic radical activating enzyme